MVFHAVQSDPKLSTVSKPGLELFTLLAVPLECYNMGVSHYTQLQQLFLNGTLNISPLKLMGAGQSFYWM